MPLQIRRGPEADLASVTPADGEPIYTTDTNKLFIGDGVTPGGNQILGYTGSAGVGFTGSQGETGFTGSGGQGYTGSAGAFDQNLNTTDRVTFASVTATGYVQIGTNNVKIDTYSANGGIKVFGALNVPNLSVDAISGQTDAGPKDIESGSTIKRAGSAPNALLGTTSTPWKAVYATDVYVNSNVNADLVNITTLRFSDGSTATSVTQMTGYTGSAGPIGYSGSVGATGLTGSTGFDGSQGSAGYTGSASTVAGPTGPQGPIGYTGSVGPGVPSGGAVGEYLVKNSLTDYDLSWTDRVNAKTIYETVKNVSGGSLTKGTPVYQVGMSGNTVTVGAARADDVNKLAIGVLNETIADEAEGQMTVLGEIKGVNTAAFSTGDKIYLGATGGYTNTASTSSSVAIQFLGVVFRVDNTNGSGFITGTLVEDSVRYTGSNFELWNGTSWTAFGATGYTGSAGVTGYTGSQGSTGDTGPTGPQGTTGYTGSIGSQGVTGFTGSKGATGDVGPTGPQGTTGFTGSVGATGPSGPSGPQGPIGYTGSAGANGYNINYLAVGGGGGGGSNYGGGGGAGGVTTGTFQLLSGQTLQITVGAGGAGGSLIEVKGGNGNNSVIATGVVTYTTAIGGGGGGFSGAPPAGNGNSGGSGGGGGTRGGTANVGGSGTFGQGNAGGNGNTTGPFSSGGGGGAGFTGSAGGASLGGYGGGGIVSAITGTNVTYGGGGGGGSERTGGAALGGAGGGGNGGWNRTNIATAGTANLGGGGGGGHPDPVSTSYRGQNGGSGVVVLSVPTANYTAIFTGTVTTSTVGSSVILRFTGSGSYLT